MRFIYIKLNNK